MRVVLGIDPYVNVVGAVEDAAADFEAAGSDAEVAPVAQGGYGCAEDGGGFVDGEQVVVRPMVVRSLAGRVWSVMVCSRCRGWEIGPSLHKAEFEARLVTFFDG